MIRLPVRELELLRDRVVALLQFERAHADLTDETWIARRLELRLKLQAIDDQIDQERPDQCTQPTAPGATFGRVHGGPLMPSKDVPLAIPRVTPVVTPRRMWLHPTEPAEVILPVPITESQPTRDLAPHLSYTEIESRARSLVSHHYASMGRKRSRRYEGFR